MVLGARVAELRKAAGMAQVELAVAIGDRYNQQMISHIETGRSGLLVDGLVQLARVFNVSTDYLLGLTDDPTPVSNLVTRVASITSYGDGAEPSEVLKQPLEFSGSHSLRDEDIVTYFKPFPEGIGTYDSFAVFSLWSLSDADRSEAYPADLIRIRGRREVSPAVEVHFPSGGLSFVDRGNRTPPIDPTQCSVVDVPGSSMEPTLPEGSTVIVDKSRGRVRRRAGGIFLLYSGDGIFIRRAGRGPRGYWQLVCDALDRETTFWPRDVRIMGEVRWLATPPSAKPPWAGNSPVWR